MVHIIGRADMHVTGNINTPKVVVVVEVIFVTSHQRQWEETSCETGSSLGEALEVELEKSVPMVTNAVVMAHGQRPQWHVHAQKDTMELAALIIVIQVWRALTMVDVLALVVVFAILDMLATIVNTGVIHL